MKNTGRLMLILSFLLAILTSGLVYLYLKNLDSTEVVELENTTIYVASQDIMERTLVTNGMVKSIDVPSDYAYGNYVDEKDLIVGKYVTEKIYMDEQFHSNKLSETIADKLNLKINGSHRAVAVSISGASGIANILEPGDYVDVVAVLPELKENNRIVRPDVAKIILQNIEILAINKSLYLEETIVDDVQPENEDAAASKIYIATLSIPFQEVEQITLVERVGSIELALRPLDGDYIYKTEGTVWQEILLNEFGEMKDMFPSYEIDSKETPAVESADYKYEKYTYYTVEYGDSLRSISKKFYGTEDNYILIKQVNKIIDENIIVTGTGIKIPKLEKVGDVNE